MIVILLMLLVIGFIMLIKGADIFVDGSSALAKNFKVPSLIIGLTIVALGTSAPELAVSTSAAFQGSNEIALSNVIGSNIFNLLCVLGICAIIHPLPVDKGVLKRDFPFSIFSTILLLFLSSCSFLLSGKLFQKKYENEIGMVSRITGLVMLILFIGYICILINTAKNSQNEDKAEDIPSIRKCIVLIIIGLVFIIAGGQVVVYSSKEIARAFGMTETLIGLTIVAVGTSLPELVTSIVAARKGETGLAIGNVVGSNIFNIMFILGISSLIHPVAVNVASVFDMLILIIVSILTFIFSLSNKKLSRVEGIIMVLIYVADTVFAILR